ncbi:hypothetical protein [Paenibacillus typhae]|uniref:Uncharacterized protein n=1 Tax=Paenibacillus typhae TaxID=1174501 RepID=A0A1G8Y2J4_9BACL|nr:hypothetical protein [Paenibacillus typhae]SDJ96335.1 hypothetical protein SAMN05216192_1287 [Paenibacillus typhae]
MKNTTREIITKKDLFYWIVFLLITILLTTTLRLTPNAQVVDYFSFGGTLASILLAVVAMIYSFYQSFSMQSSSERLNDSVNKIEKSLDNLEEFDEGLQKITYEIGIAGRELSASTTVLKDSLLTTIDELRNRLNSIENYNITNNDLIKNIYQQFDSHKKDTEIKETEQNLGITICEVSDIHRNLLVCFYKVYKANKPFSTDDITKMYLKREELEPFEGVAYLSLILAYLALLNSAKMIKMKNINEDKELIIETFNQELETYVLSKLEEA